MVAKTAKTTAGVSALDRLKGRAVPTQLGTEQEVLIPLERLKFDPTQPRKAFHALDGRVSEKDQQYIKELAESIKENGLIQAITVQEQGDGTYLVVVGECRSRAHLLLGLPTIRATVRNDLTSHAQRLIYQVAENVNRQDLSDEELSLSIRSLLEGGDDGKPMTQAAVAARLGKSEGWVTRFVKFGDEELQRVWVKSGIADTVEKVYRLSILPKEVQMNILRRVELAEGDPERLEKPLNRNVIDQINQEMKDAKARESLRKSGATGQVGTAGMGTGGGSSGLPSAAGAGDVPGESGGARMAGNEPLDLALQEMLADGKVGGADTLDLAGTAGSASVVELGGGGGSEAPAPTSSSGYALPAEVREALLSGSTLDTQYGASMSADDLRLAPVHVRASVRNMEGLLAMLGDDGEALEFARSIRCDLIVPHSLAEKIANRLAGVVVGEQEVASVVQSGLVKLGN